MRQSLTLFVVGIAASLALSQETDDLKPFQGSWDLVRIETNGLQFLPSKKNPKEKLGVATFKGGRLDFDGDDYGTITLDPSKTPKQINLISKPPAEGIYKFEGDTLLICWAELKGVKRPQEFKTGGDQRGTRLWTLKRVPKK